MISCEGEALALKKSKLVQLLPAMFNAPGFEQMPGCLLQHSHLQHLPYHLTSAILTQVTLQNLYFTQMNRPLDYTSYFTHIALFSITKKLAQNSICWHAANFLSTSCQHWCMLKLCASPAAPSWARLLLFCRAMSSSCCCSCRAHLIANLLQLPPITKMMFPPFTTLLLNIYICSPLWTHYWFTTAEF